MIELTPEFINAYSTLIEAERQHNQALKELMEEMAETKKLIDKILGEK